MKHTGSPRAAQEVVEDLHKGGKHVLICGVRPTVWALLSRQAWFNKMVMKREVFMTKTDALAAESKVDPGVSVRRKASSVETKAQPSFQGRGATPMLEGAGI